MPLPISLRAVAEEFGLVGGASAIRAFLNRRTGELFAAADEQISRALDEELEFVGWEVEAVAQIREVRYALLSALDGRRPFRPFGDSRTRYTAAAFPMLGTLTPAHGWPSWQRTG